MMVQGHSTCKPGWGRPVAHEHGLQWPTCRVVCWGREPLQKPPSLLGTCGSMSSMLELPLLCKICRVMASAAAPGDLAAGWSRYAAASARQPWHEPGQCLCGTGKSQSSQTPAAASLDPCLKSLPHKPLVPLGQVRTSSSGDLKPTVGYSSSSGTLAKATPISKPFLKYDIVRSARLKAIPMVSPAMHLIQEVHISWPLLNRDTSQLYLFQRVAQMVGLGGHSQKPENVRSVSSTYSSG